MKVAVRAGTYVDDCPVVPRSRGGSLAFCSPHICPIQISQSETELSETQKKQTTECSSPFPLLIADLNISVIERSLKREVLLFSATSGGLKYPSH